MSSRVVYIIDLGPEGGSDGGQIVAAGTPEEVARSRRATPDGTSDQGSGQRKRGGDMIDLEINGAVLEGIDLIIFDKDGTLFQLYPYWSRMALLRGRCICRALMAKAAAVQPASPLAALQMGVDLAEGRISPHGPAGIESRQHIQNLRSAGGCREMAMPQTRISSGRHSVRPISTSAGRRELERPMCS